MNDLSQMQACDIFPWREGGREEVAERFKPQVGCRPGNPKMSPLIIDARCLLSKFTFVIIIIPTTCDSETVKPEPFLMLNSNIE